VNSWRFFPEGVNSANKPFSERYRVRDFRLDQAAPAIEEGVHIYRWRRSDAMKRFRILLTPENLKKMLGLPALPVTPFYPWLPFPLNFASFPVRWYMSVCRHVPYKTTTDRDELEELSKRQTRFVQGEIQAELNRLLRGRAKSYV